MYFTVLPPSSYEGFEPSQRSKDAMRAFLRARREAGDYARGEPLIFAWARFEDTRLCGMVSANFPKEEAPARFVCAASARTHLVVYEAGGFQEEEPAQR